MGSHVRANPRPALPDTTLGCVKGSTWLRGDSVKGKLAGMRRAIALVAALAATALLALVWTGQTSRKPDLRPSEAVTEWAGLEPQMRCAEALVLVTVPARHVWPMACRWRVAGEGLQGQAFPPPKGPPPYDDPHIEIYVAPNQSREDLANAIAHELGHMHHTREPTFVAEWLSTRNLPPDTPSEAWTEDYAEVFAALFSPPADHWRAPTPRPSPEALAALKSRFFS